MKLSSKAFAALLVAAVVAGPAATPAFAAGTGYGSSSGGGDINKSSDFRRAKALVAAGDYAAAIPKLEQVALQEPDNADVFNMLGFSYRKSGDTDRAAPNYEKALQLNPKHRGALEYQGELFLTLNQPEKAEANLAKINEICWLKCDEARELENAIALWREANGS
ncbi:MAG: tetratricopeptide repeat protein [Pikeienuella sp.]